MEMKRHVLAILAVVYALVAATLCSAQNVPVYIRVMDTVTHFGVQAKVKFKGPETLATETDRSGKATINLPPGEYQEEVTAAGYKPMIYEFTLLPGENALANGRDPHYPTGAMLDPIRPPEEIEEADKLIRPGYTLVDSYAVDEEGQPVADVHVHLQGKSTETVDATTNARGFFAILVPTPPAATPPVIAGTENLPATADVVAEKPGYKTQVHTNIPLMDGSVSSVSLDMVRGSGTIKSDDAPGWLNGTAGTCIGEHACEDVDKTPSHLKAKPDSPGPSGPSTRKAPVTPGNISLPSTIIVGKTCTGGCSVACSQAFPPYSLESYVQQGLQNEWTASWPADSLEAGAVAYRTIGAYWVQQRRVPPNLYNIRSDACNQIFAPTGNPNSNTQAAAIATAGIALSDDGAHAYFSEYAQEGNNHGCGDGFTGDNIDWPCLADPIATGSYSPGSHGRGMGQWGSWWWARGQSNGGQNVLAPGWQCILDHYYNDNGNATGAGGSNTYRYSFIYGPGGDGTIAFPVDPGNGYYQVYTMAMDGSKPRAVTPSSNDPYYGGPAWSPDQKTLAYTAGTNSFNVFTISASGNGTPTPITFGSVLINYMASGWSRSGNNLLALNGQSTSSLASEIYSINASLPGQPTQLTFDFPLQNFVPFWSPDGYHLAFQQTQSGCDPNNDFCSYIIASANGSQEYKLYGAPVNLYTGAPGWSPDGSTIVFYAYTPSCNGYPAIYSVNVLGGTPTPLNCIPNSYLWSPRYSQDGRYIVAAYWSGSPSSSVIPYVMNADGTGGTPVGNLGSPQWGEATTLDVTRCMRLDILQPAD
jgi:hypothetical protein